MSRRLMHRATIAVLLSVLFLAGCSHLARSVPAKVYWTAPGSLEAVTSGKVGAHGIKETASR
jgi:hypothetical protein